MSLPAEPAVLASDADRDAAARGLTEAFADGRLTAAEHGDRVHAVYAARTWPELAELTVDLPAAVGPAAAPTADWAVRLDPCLLCLLLCLCPPAGIAVLLWRRRAEDR